jgi:hypothetical protein
MDLIDLKLSITSIDILQKAGIWSVSGLLDVMENRPSVATLALARIKEEDFTVIMDAIKERTKNVLDNNDKPR